MTPVTHSVTHSATLSNSFPSPHSPQVTMTVPAYCPMALMCDIGGALGLVLGSTFLTVFEVIDFLCILLYKSLSAKRAVDVTKS